MNASIMDMALALAATGIPVFPCNAKKRPITENGFLDATTNPDIIRTIFTSAAKLIGVPTGPASGINALDLDYRHGAGAWEEANISRLPETRIHQTQSGGRHLLFRSASEVRNSAGRIAPGVDVRGAGGYIVWSGSPGYTVISDTTVAPWPEWLLVPGMVLPKSTPERPISPGAAYSPASNTRLEGYRNSVLENVRRAAEGQKHTQLRNAARALGGIQNEAGFSDEEATGWLMDALPSTVNDWKQAAKTAVYGLASGREEPIKLEDRPKAQPRVAHSTPQEPPDAEDGDPGYEPFVLGNVVKIKRAAPTKKPAIDDDDLITEGAVAEAFSASHRDTFQFDHDAGSWFMWTGAFWRKERTKPAFRWAHDLARQQAKDTGNDKAMIQAGKASFAAGVERIAQSDPVLAVTNEVWDADPWLLGTPAGTVDLRTGKLNPAKQSDHITKTTAIAPADRADCPQWLDFLNQATNGDQALVDFLRRWFGYTLTGITREHALLFVFGDGGNGKGVCMNTIAGIMGDYAVNAAMDSFTATKGDKHPTDMAMLAGARMVMTTEVDEGQVWAEARLKSLTGGDPITARFMRRDFFTFTPAFKLTISGNHKPALRNVDAAARRRFNLAPFIHRPATPDKMLPEKLKAEWPEILRWMIDGCLEWQRDGLQQPEAVKLATEEYFEEQAVMPQWIEESCDQGKAIGDTITNLFASWRSYAVSRGEDGRHAKWFGTTLEKHGFRRDKDCELFRGRGFRGIKVKPIDVPQHWQDRD